MDAILSQESIHQEEVYQECRVQESALQERLSQERLLQERTSRERISGRKERPRIRDEPVIKGILGIYSPVHRIGKTKYALRIGRQMAARAHCLYLNLEGCSGGSFYFPEKEGCDMGDLNVS